MSLLQQALQLVGWRELLAAALLLTPFEHLLPVHRKPQVLRPGWQVDLMHWFASGLFIRAGLVLVVLVAAALGEAWMPARWRTALQGWPVALQVLLLTTVADLGFYAAHRAMHRLPVLWRFHAVHHSSPALDWLAAYRVHPVDQIVVKGVSLLPVCFLGFSTEAILIAAGIYQVQSLLLHSNIRLPLGPLQRLVAGPVFHHWHHAADLEARDKNFAGQLPLWDALFGTLHLPGGFPVRYGIDEPVPASWLGQLRHGFRPAAAAARDPRLV